MLCYALSNTANAQARRVEATFTTEEFELKQGDVISNVLRVVNIGYVPTKFYVNIDYPADWKLLYNTNTLYEFNPNDTLYIPIRLVPNGKNAGSSRFMISAFCVSDDDFDLGHDIFWAFSRKVVSWNVSTIPIGTVYFKNGESEAKFHVNVMNTGTESQPIMYALNNMSLYSEVVDTVGTALKKTQYVFMLNPFQDTSFHYLFKYTQGRRNNKLIDIENYRPDNMSDEKSFNVFINTEEPNFGQPGSFNTQQRLVFKKLTDDKMVRRQAYNELPIIVDYNVSNLLDDITFSTLSIRGQAIIGPEQSLVYNLQGNAIGNNYEEFAKNSNYYVGYFHTRGSLQAGYINGGITGLQGFGRGAKGSININKKNTVSGFYVANQDRNGKLTHTSYGAGYQVKYYKQNSFTVNYGHSDNAINGTKSDVLNARLHQTFLRTQTFSASFSQSWNANTALNSNWGAGQTMGHFYIGNYNGNFLKNRLTLTHSYGESSKGYANSLYARQFYNHRARYLISQKWSVMMVNNRTNNKSDVLNYDNLTFTNRLSFIRSFKTQSIQPIIFYNEMRIPQLTYHNRGAGMNYNFYSPEENTRVSTTLEIGNNQPIGDASQKPESYLQWSNMLFYKTFSMNARYIIGNIGMTGQANTTGKLATPQLFSTSMQHQYLFKNTRFMLQTNVNYFYNNLFKQHNLSFSPEIYFFTVNGWRFRTGMTFGYTQSEAVTNFYNRQTGTSSESDNPATIINQSTFFSLGVRKEFTVTVPFTKSSFANVDITAFYDINGNGIKDKNERVVENVVVKIGDEEVITNKAGEAHIHGTKMGMQKFVVMSLDPVPGWFANVDDTIMIVQNKQIMIPFVRGVRVKGKVSIDREAIAADADIPFDLSLIKITALGQRTQNVLTQKDGEFEFFLPYGHYIFTMDESILGSRFKLARNNYEVDVVKESDGLYISYLIIEKKRRVNKKVFKQGE